MQKEKKKLLVSLLSGELLASCFQAEVCPFENVLVLRMREGTR